MVVLIGTNDLGEHTSYEEVIKLRDRVARELSSWEPEPRICYCTKTRYSQGPSDRVVSARSSTRCPLKNSV